MSLFTILLRAGEHYKPGTDWKECLFANPYAEETKEVIEYFLNGNTIYCGDERWVQGWFNTFSYNGNYKELLRRPRLSAIRRWFKGWVC